jgi:signal transduction histidine kinase
MTHGRFRAAPVGPRDDAAGTATLSPLALDLHDGPLQDLAALLGDVRHFRTQLDESLPATELRDLLLGRVDDLELRVLALEESLRDLTRPSDPSDPRAPDVHELLEAEIAEFRSETGIRTTLAVRGDLQTLPGAHRFALLRVVGEALSNVRKHSGAREVCVEVRREARLLEAAIADDGFGLDVERALFRGARNGRLGLVGMSERARRLGGTLDVKSSPGGPTRVALSLPVSEEETRPQAEAKPSVQGLGHSSELSI